MSFTVGLLEVLGYLVPGASVVTVAILVYPSARIDLGDPRCTLVIYVLASYVIGHALNVLSYLLPFVRKKMKGHPPRNYPFFPRLQQRLVHAFGADLGPAEEYHLSQALAIEACPRSSDRIERYFALALLMRNLSVAALLSMLLTGSVGLYRWAGVCAILVGLFTYQHFQFEATRRGTLFRAAFLAFTLPALGSLRPKGVGSADVLAAQREIEGGGGG
jgi:hypothetical protein